MHVDASLSLNLRTETALFRLTASFDASQVEGFFYYRDEKKKCIPYNHVINGTWLMLKILKYGIFLL